MKEKLKLFMEHQGITAAQLADQIGVLRSSFSHILNGRNKPSADFISKLLQSYPDLNANWLFDNSETMYLSKRIKQNNLFSADQGDLISDEKKPETVKLADMKTVEKEETTIEISLPKPSGSKSVAKIVFFYSDDSFKVYAPE